MSSTYPNDNIFGSSEEPVQNSSRKGGVQAIRRRQLSKKSIRHGLWYDDHADSQTGDGITQQPAATVPPNPRRRREEALDVVVGAGPRGCQLPEELGHGGLLLEVDVRGLEGLVRPPVEVGGLLCVAFIGVDAQDLVCDEVTDLGWF